MPLLIPRSARRKRLLRALSGILLLFAATFLWNHSQLGRRMEQATLDYRFAHFNRETKASDRVIIIDIDEESMKLLGTHYGRWPWPRKIYQEMIDFLAAGEPAGIFFDLLFTESQLGTQDDQILAEASARTGLPSHAMLILPKDPSHPSFEPLPIDIRSRFGLRLEGNEPTFASQIMDSGNFLLPAPAYLPKIPRLHVVTTEKDQEGGIYRRLPPAFKYGETWLPSLTLRALMATLKNPKISAEERKFVLRDDVGTRHEIPLERDGRMRLNYYKPQNGFEIIPFAAVIQSAAELQSGKVTDPSQLKVNPLSMAGKILLVGGSAAGLEDLKATPVSPSLPGVHLHATAISNVLTQDFLKPVPEIVEIGLSLLTLVIIYACVLLFENLVLQLALPAVWMSVYVAAALLLFRHGSIWLEIARPLALGTLSLFNGLSFLIFVEGKEKKKLKETLTKYLPPALAEQMIASGQDPHAEVGTRRELSILFSDIRGFTTLSESTDAERLVAILNQYLGRMTGIVFENMGTLDKFIGDAVMAFWGAPIEDPLHANRAVRTALQMKKALAELNAEWASRGIAPLAIGVGINTGEVIVGNIGSDQRLDYTVIGDNVNLASRLEGLTKQYHLEFIVGTRTEELVRDSIICRPVDAVRVKGKKNHVNIYEPLAEASSQEAGPMRALAAKTSAALSEFQKGHFIEARALYQEIDRSIPGGDGLSQVFIERCDELIAEPPQEWDGVFTAKSK